MRLERGAHVHTLVARVVHKTIGKAMFGPRFMTTSLNGRVLEVIKREKNHKQYTYIRCAFMLNKNVKEVTIPLGQVKAGLSEHRERDFDRPEDDPMFEVNKLFEADFVQPNSTQQVQSPLPCLTDHSSSAQVASGPANPPEPNGFPAPQHFSSVARRAEPREPPELTLSPSGDQNESGKDDVLCDAHGQKWYAATDVAEVNETLREIDPHVTLSDGRTLRRGIAPETLSLYDVFLSLFPLEYLSQVVLWTTEKLQRYRKRATSSGEILKLFGVFILMTRVKFSSRRSLWTQKKIEDCLPAYNFGRLMPRVRFEDLLSALTFGPDPDKTILDMAGVEREKWKCVEPFIRAFNRHREQNVYASHELCVDESISRWYGLGGSWSRVGCPHILTLDRKPEHGMEIQNIACAITGVMIGLKLVKSAQLSNNDVSGSPVPEDTHGGKVLRELCEPWADKPRCINADSYFASICAATNLLVLGLFFRGVVKTGSRRFPLSFFNDQCLSERGDSVALVSDVVVDGSEKKVAAIMWRDRNRRFYVTTTGDIKSKVKPERMRWRDFDDGTCPTDVGVEIPVALSKYHDAAGAIDRHNRIRQDLLDLEKAVGTHRWELRLACTILGIILTDVRNLYNFGRSGRKTLPPFIMFAKLGGELVNNQFDSAGIERTSATYYEEGEDVLDNDIRCELTDIMMSVGDGQSPRRVQRRCNVCGRKTSRECNICKSDHHHLFICCPGTGRLCFETHCRHLNH